MLVWSARCPQGTIIDGTDSYLVRDGRIAVQSEPGRGSTFWFVLPVASPG